MFLVIRFHRKNPPSERFSAFITDEGERSVATVQDLEESEDDVLIVYAQELQLGDEEGVHFAALWTLLAEGDEIKPGWLAIEQVALQAFLAGVSSGRSFKFPIPVSVT